jgi:hypothetical protein
VGITAAGKLVNVKEEITANQDPAVLKKGLQQKFPGAKIVEAEKITTGEGAAAKVTFELVIRVGKENRDVELDSEGKVVGETK